MITFLFSHNKQSAHPIQESSWQAVNNTTNVFSTIFIHEQWCLRYTVRIVGAASYSGGAH